MILQRVSPKPMDCWHYRPNTLNKKTSLDGWFFLFLYSRFKSYDNPEITPFLSIVIPSEAGIFGKPGIRIIFPKIGIIN